MKKIGIIFAMEEEINAFKEHIHIDKEESIFDLHLYEGTFNNNQCIFTVSGVGKVNSARTCQILIDHYNTDIVINVGVAGGINSSLKVGDIVIGNKWNDIVKKDETTNEVVLIGFVCKKPIYTQTPFGREIADLLLAVNRAYNKSDYIPTIAWGRNARFCQNLEVGAQVKIVGRVQSRQYEKKYEDGTSEMKVAYEVSICSLELINEEGTEKKEETENQEAV